MLNQCKINLENFHQIKNKENKLKTKMKIQETDN